MNGQLIAELEQAAADNNSELSSDAHLKQLHTPSHTPQQQHSALRTALLLTERRLQEKERHLRLAAEMGDLLIRQQEDSEERERLLSQQMSALTQRAEEESKEKERQREELSRLRVQLRDAVQSAEEAKRRVQEAEEAMQEMETQLERERTGQRRREQRQQSSASQQLTAETAALQSQLSALQSQQRALQERLQAVQAERDEEKRRREEAEAEARDWAQTVDERDTAAAAVQAEHREEMEELRYRLQQAQDALPVSPPVLTPPSFPSFPVMEGAEEQLETEPAAVSVEAEREEGRNVQLSRLGYESLLAELESELQEEVDCRRREGKRLQDETDRAEEEERKKKQRQQQQEEQEEEEQRLQAEKENPQVLQVNAAIAEARQAERAAATAAQVKKPLASKLSYFAWLTGGKPAATTPTATHLLCPSSAPPAAAPAAAAATAHTDVLREYFHLACLSVKLSSVDTNLRACNANVSALYEAALKQDVPFHRWHHWLQQTMLSMTATAAGSTAQRSPGKSSEKVMYSHGVSVRHRPSMSAGLHRGVRMRK